MSVKNSYFVGSRISAMENSDVNVDNCEFMEEDGQVLSATRSKLKVNGCYLHADEDHVQRDRNSRAISATLGSNLVVQRNLICGTGNGIMSIDSDVICISNIIINCSQRYIRGLSLDGLDLKYSDKVNSDIPFGLYTGISVKQDGGHKIQVNDNYILKCDVGVYIGKNSIPIVKSNNIVASYFTGVFVECGARPNLIANTLEAKLLKTSNEETGLGMLFLLNSNGLVGKNKFSEFDLSPIMVFGSCHPMIKDNEFEAILIDRKKQSTKEQHMRELFQAELFKDDTYFYIVDSEESEEELRQLILNGK